MTILLLIELLFKLSHLCPESSYFQICLSKAVGYQCDGSFAHLCIFQHGPNHFEILV